MTEKNDIISVIIPNYNNAEFVEQCVESVLAQTYPKVEAVVVDDASEDGSREIIDKLAGKSDRVKAVFNARNLKVSATRNAGFEAASGYFLTTLDSDDVYFNPKKNDNELELFYKKLDSDGEEILPFSRVALLNKNGKFLRYRENEQDLREGDIFEEVITWDCPIPRDFIFTRKQLAAAGDYDPSLRLYEDWDIKTRLAKRFKFFYTGESGVGYRILRRGLSSMKSAEQIECIRIAFEKNKVLIPPEKFAEIENGLERNLEVIKKELAKFDRKSLGYFARNAIENFPGLYGFLNKSGRAKK